jgi:hypothetical protein
LKTSPIVLLIVVGIFMIGCASYSPGNGSGTAMLEAEKEEGMRSIVKCLTTQILIHDDKTSPPEDIAPLVAHACRDEIEEFRLKAIRGHSRSYADGFTDQWAKIKEPTICNLIVRTREEMPVGMTRDEKL